MSAPKPAVGDICTLTNWPNKLFFLNSLFELALLVLQRVKSARAHFAEPQNQEQSTRKQERLMTEAAFENSAVGVAERRELK